MTVASTTGTSGDQTTGGRIARGVSVARRQARRPGALAAAAWAGFVVAGLWIMDLIGTTALGWVAPLGALALVAAQWRRPPGGVTWLAWRPDRRDLETVAVLYLAVVALLRLAFGVFGTDRVAGLFLAFAVGLVLGVGGPVVYTVWGRHLPLASLGLTGERLPATIALALLFAGVQAAVTLWGMDLPEPEGWVPLLVMALVVGIFETVFFRGFVQMRLEASLGALPGTAAAAALYALYHVGYGMGAEDMVFLFGLGVVYAVAFRLVRNGLVLWPLLTPLGSFFANVNAGEIDLPWASILGFVDVAAVMVTVVALAARHQHRAAGAAAGRSAPPAGAGPGPTSAAPA